jgi:hypothetical protein
MDYLLAVAVAVVKEVILQARQMCLALAVQVVTVMLIMLHQAVELLEPLERHLQALVVPLEVMAVLALLEQAVAVVVVVPQAEQGQAQLLAALAAQEHPQAAAVEVEEVQLPLWRHLQLKAVTVVTVAVAF